MPRGYAKTECACEKCQRACENVPGWFRPGEAEKAAAFLKLTMRAFFKRYLGVNWWCDSRHGDVFALAPAILHMTPGEEYPANPKGCCVFFTADRRCMIHPVKPFHCSHGDPHAFDEARHKSDMKRTVTLWRKEQSQIVKLLKRDPVSEDISIFDAMFL